MARNERRKHIPQRTCIICRRTLSKRELNRIVRSQDGVQYDPSSKVPGRGAYLCQDPHCWEQAIQGRALGRALKTKLNTEERMALRSEIEGRTATDTKNQSDESVPLS